MKNFVKHRMNTRYLSTLFDTNRMNLKLNNDLRYILTAPWTQGIGFYQ